MMNAPLDTFAEFTHGKYAPGRFIALPDAPWRRSIQQHQPIVAIVPLPEQIAFDPPFEPCQLYLTKVIQDATQAYYDQRLVLASAEGIPELRQFYAEQILTQELSYQLTNLAEAFQAHALTSVTTQADLTLLRAGDQKVMESYVMNILKFHLLLLYNVFQEHFKDVQPPLYRTESDLHQKFFMERLSDHFFEAALEDYLSLPDEKARKITRSFKPLVEDPRIPPDGTFTYSQIIKIPALQSIADEYLLGIGVINPDYEIDPYAKSDATSEISAVVLEAHARGAYHSEVQVGSKLKKVTMEAIIRFIDNRYKANIKDRLHRMNREIAGGSKGKFYQTRLPRIQAAFKLYDKRLI